MYAVGLEAGDKYVASSCRFEGPRNCVWWFSIASGYTRIITLHWAGQELHAMWYAQQNQNDIARFYSVRASSTIAENAELDKNVIGLGYI